MNDCAASGADCSLPGTSSRRPSPAIRKWAGHPQAVTVGEFLRANAAIQLVPTGEETREAAWRLFRKHRGLVLSFTDCTSFVVMRHFGITEAFTFDDDFRRAGFTVLPPPA